MTRFPMMPIPPVPPTVIVAIILPVDWHRRQSFAGGIGDAINGNSFVYDAAMFAWCIMVDDLAVFVELLDSP